MEIICVKLLMYVLNINDDFITNYAVPTCLSEDKEKIENVRTPNRLDISV